MQMGQCGVRLCCGAEEREAMAACWMADRVLRLGEEGITIKARAVRTSQRVMRRTITFVDAHGRACLRI